MNNAGVPADTPTVDISSEEVQKIFAINVYTTIFMVQSVIPHMPPGGRIINISSAVSKLGFGNASLYGAAKAAVDALSYAWAQEV